MTRALAIAGRDLRVHFFSAGGYIIACLFLFFSGLVFISRGFDQGQVASMRVFFSTGTVLLLFIAPAITMRAISDELRMGTFEMIMTCPISERELIVGKFLGALGFLAVLLVPTGAYVLALEMYGRPDYGEIFCGYAGMLLAGSAFLASGIFVSALTNSQVVAYLITFFFWLLLSQVTAELPAYLPDYWAGIVFALDPGPRLRDFAIGLVDSSNIVYFLSFVVVFLMAAVRAVRARRLA